MENINSLNLLNYAPQPLSAPSESRAAGCCTMVRMERTAGYIPSYDSLYDKPSGETQNQAFERIVQEQLNPEDNSYSLTLDERKMQSGGTQGNENRFDVFDFLDMINPLQHIPVVNYAYRYLTGDGIKPISSIIGGAVFAGPVGAATGLASAVAEQEVGGSLPEAVLSIASGEGAAAYEKYAGYVSSKPISANYDYNT